MGERRTYEVTMSNGRPMIMEIPAGWKWTLGPLSPTRRDGGSKYDKDSWTKGWMLRVYADASKKDQRMAQGEVLAVRQLSDEIVFRTKVPTETFIMEPDQEGVEEESGYHLAF